MRRSLRSGVVPRERFPPGSVASGGSTATRTSACRRIEASSGSLGMGISKGRGIALGEAARSAREGRVVVMTGDGELQEGQNWEVLQLAASRAASGVLGVVVDRNDVKSDKRTEEIVALGDLEAKLRAFGW